MSNLNRAGRPAAQRFFLAALLALVPATPAFAQESEAQQLFDQGMAHYHNGDHDKAIASFRQVVSLAPDEAVAYQLLNQSQDALLQLMVAGGEYETFAEEVLAAASNASREALRDADAAAEAAAACFDDDFGTRSRAIADLGFRFGPFAGPPLIAELGAQSEDRRLKAIYALSRVGMEVAQPVLAATWSDNADVRAGALLVLAELNDARAAARIADLAANDPEGKVRKIASSLAVSAPAADMLYEQGWDYLDGDGEYGLGSVENYGVLFVAEGSGVRAVDMLPSLVPCELAKMHFLRSLELGNADAAIALATAYASEVSILDAALAEGNDEYQSARNMQAASALTLGNAVLADALVNAVAENKVGAAQALVTLVDGTNQASALALQHAAANASTVEVRFHAALKLAHLGQADAAVVGLLVEAATLDAPRVVHMIDPDQGRASSLASELRSQGIYVVHSADGTDGMINAHRSVLVDAFVIADPLPDFYASRIVKEIRKDDRFTDTPILILGNDDSGEVDSAELLDEASADAITSAFGDLGVDRERYLATAAAAAEALAQLAANGTDLGAAAGGMLGALGREDAVAIPAARALGHAGSSDAADALLALAADDSRSVEARTAAAQGLAGVASRNSVSVDASALQDLIGSDDAALSMAAARALAACGGSHLASRVETE